MKKILIGLAVLTQLSFSMDFKDVDSYTKFFYEFYTGKELKIPIMYGNLERSINEKGNEVYVSGLYYRYSVTNTNFKDEYIVYDLEHTQNDKYTEVVDTIVHELAHKINADNGHTGHGKEFKKIYEEMLDMVDKM